MRIENANCVMLEVTFLSGEKKNSEICASFYSCLNMRREQKTIRI